MAGQGGRGYTWGNSRGAKSRLDRIYVSQRWGLNNFTVSPTWVSDHCMVGVVVDVEVGASTGVNLGGGARGFYWSGRIFVNILFGFI